MVFTFLVGRARSPESGGLSSPDTRPKRDTTPLPWSTVDPALHLLGHISHWSRAALAALGPYSREQEQGCAFPHSTNFAPICTELLNQAAIVVVHLSYGPSCYRCRPRRQLPYSVRCALFSSKLSGVSVSKDERCTLREAHVWAWAGHDLCSLVCLRIRQLQPGSWQLMRFYKISRSMTKAQSQMPKPGTSFLLSLASR